jgi:cell division control protein 6
MSKIFKDEKSLLPDTLPPEMLFRENEIRALASNFKIFFGRRRTEKAITNLSTVILILGGPGQGKSTLARITTNRVVELAQKNNVNLISSYQNCWRHRTLIRVISNIFEDLNLEGSKKGISLDEQIAGILLPYLIEEDLHLLLVLDEINRLKSDEINSLFSLLELTNRISMIFISRPTEWQILLTPDLNQKITDTISLYPYTIEELFSIIKYRISLALQPSVYDADLINLIGEMTARDQNLRLGLEIVFRAAKIAEKNGSDFVEPEYIRSAKDLSFPELRSDILQELKIHELFALLGIGRRLQNRKFTTVSIKEAYRQYKFSCSEYFEDAKKISSFRTYLKNLHDLGLINQIKTSAGRGKRGVKARISIIDIPVNLIVERVEDQIEKFYN